MAEYRKKPVVVQAHQWFKNGDHPEDNVGETLVDPVHTGKTYDRVEGAVVGYFRRPEPEFKGDLLHHRCGHIWHNHGWIDTLEGGNAVCPGDWVITGVKGERYPCKPDIFAETYEATDPIEQLREALGTNGRVTSHDTHN